MDVIRKGLRLSVKESETGSEERRVSVNNSRTSQVMKSLTSTSSTPQTSSLGPETTMKNKLVSAWNNVKYGKKAWATSEMFKTGFSNNSLVWLLGQVRLRLKFF